jgi:predicted O-methyltransferase YrrM
MSESLWADVDEFLERALLPDDVTLGAALRDSARAGLPAIQVPPLQGAFLRVIARAIAARRILEIGTLGGYSTIWLAGGLADGGLLTTLELEPTHADVARHNIDRAGLGARVDIRVGPAVKSLEGLAGETFDLTFIDADKVSTSAYFDWAVSHTRRGGLVIVDNVVRQGALGDPASDDVNVKAMREFVIAVGKDDRVEMTVLQTVGRKSYDGFAVAVVR